MDALEKLQQMTVIAGDIRTYLSDIPEFEPGLVHFRPTASGVTMVSLSHERPQLGNGGYSAEALRENFSQEFATYCENAQLGRPTPEKQLQSFLIGDAYRHQRQMDALQSVLPDDEDTNLYFVTDEISVRTQDKKVVCDILAINKRSDGIAPVLMELKSSRAMKRLVEQLDDYTQVLDTYSLQYEALFSAVLGEKVTFTHPLERWMVWTSLDVSKPDRREEELLQQGIRVVGYVQEGNPFQFHVGKRP